MSAIKRVFVFEQSQYTEIAKAREGFQAAGIEFSETVCAACVLQAQPWDTYGNFENSHVFIVDERTESE